MTLAELNVYQMAMDLGERAWVQVSNWDFFAKDTVGKQLVRAVDSIAANVSEGYGRFHYRENQQSCYYGRGSLFETRTWLIKAANRSLISKETHAAFEHDINQIGRMLNAYIKSIGPVAESVHEENAAYASAPMTNDE